MVNPRVVEIIGLISVLASEDDLRQVNDVVVTKLRSFQAVRNQIAQYSVEVGDTVEWESNRAKYGTQRGRLIKKNRTRAVVRTEAGLTWNVPFTMLERVETDG